MTEYRQKPADPKGAARLWTGQMPTAKRGTLRKQAAGVFDDGGIVSHLSTRTREDLTRRYAYFLSFLAHRGRLEPSGPAAASVTEENILHYVRYLEPRVSSVTLAQSLYKIAGSPLAWTPNKIGAGSSALPTTRSSGQTARQAQ